MAYTGPSIVDYLSSTGKDSSFNARKLLAEQMGIQNYKGTGSQNTQLLTSLRHLLTKPESAPPERSLDQPSLGTTSNESRLLSIPNVNIPSTPPTQTSSIQTPAIPQTSAPKPVDLFNKTLEEMIKAAQSAGNEDLVAKRNAIIQARFNASRNATPEELRVLSPQAQASLRNLDQSGLEDQLSGVNTAIQSRETKLKNEQATRQNVLDTLLKKQQLDAPVKENLPASVQEYEYAKKNGYLGSFTDYQNEDANRKAQVAKITAGGLNSVQQNAAFKLADDYEKASGDLGKIISNYNRVVASSKDPSPAGDLSLIFAYMKTLDPTSVVREGEFATAANSGSIGDKLMNQYNKILNGERLTEAQRNDFVARAKGLYQSAINQQKQIDKTYSDRANKFGIPADYVIRSQSSYNDTPAFGSQYNSLKEYKNSVSPEQFKKISSIIQQENLDETDALKLINKLGFNSPLSMGQNGSIVPKISQKYPEGVKGGQCTTFLHSLVQFPPIGDGKTQKFASVDKFGITADQLRQNPQIGDVIVTGENKTYGHTAMINAILPNGFRVTESNFRGDERVTHDRIIPFNSPQIYGAIRGPLKV